MNDPLSQTRAQFGRLPQGGSVRLRFAGRVTALVAIAIASLFSSAGSASVADANAIAAMTSEPVPAELPEGAIGRAVIDEGVAQIEARLLVSEGPHRRVGVLFDLAEGWHLYWRNPGETGIAPQLEIDVPGYEAGAIEWPTPEVFEEADGLFTTYGYAHQVLLAAPLRKLDAGAPSDRISVDVEALVCRTECVPASFSLTRPLDIPSSAEDRARTQRIFARAADQLPTPIAQATIRPIARWLAAAPSEDESAELALAVNGCPDDAGSGSASERDKRVCPIEAAAVAATSFLPFEDQSFELSEIRATRRTDGGADSAAITMSALRVEPVTETDSGRDRLRGLVALRDRTGQLFHVAIDVPIEEARPAKAIAPPISGADSSWIQVFLLALLGGVILNGMPCVLPVLAIKVVAIADMSQRAPREVRLQGIAYTGGVLGSMALLAAVVIALRSAGHAVGWGFQFQEPLFVAGIAALLVAFALNLFGVFEIDFGQGRLAGVGQSGSEIRRSAFEGLLAVVLATPCTAPFLGTAVGFAFAASGFAILGIFLAIGAGLALPFLAVSFVPRLARFIPRSGPWMLKLRAGLGFSLLATVIWLLWVMGQSGGSDAIVGMIAMLLGLAFLLWILGQAQPIGSIWLRRGAAFSIATFAFAGFNLIDFETQPADRASLAQTDSAGWRTYSPEAVREVLGQGQPAFVVFTADWCITCKVNEKTVLKRAAVRKAYATGDFALFKADWTRRDEAIRTTLAGFGRAGVPLYLVYSPDDPESPQILSEILTQNEVISALARPAATPRG